MAKDAAVTAHETYLLKRNVVILVLLLGTMGSALYVLFSKAPIPDQTECKDVTLKSFFQIVLPTFLGGRSNKLSLLRELWLCAEAYRSSNPGFTLVAYTSMYIFLQSFALPGSLFLSILAGALYPSWQAQVLVDLCATIGASVCYLLSFTIGRQVVIRMFPDTMASFKKRVDAQQGNLMFYMMFLRLTPLVPNSFVNMSSSMVGMPFSIFFTGTMLGLIPATFIHTKTGMALRTAAVMPEKTVSQMILLFSLQFVALIPVLLKKKIEKKEKTLGGKKDTDSSSKVD